MRNIISCTDKPHSDSTWPKLREVLAERSKDVPAGERALIPSANTVALYKQWRDIRW